MTQTTLCLLVRGDQILLALKKRGFGEGHWNGCGGKTKPGESITAAAIRELEEEIGVVAKESDLMDMGKLLFYFEGKPEWDQSMRIYKIENWTGEPVESEEMRPQWFKQNEIPYDKMWPDDKYWIPKFLDGIKIEGECYFDSSGKIMQKFDLREIK